MFFLSKVPTYALDNAFQRNRNIGQLYLGANPWGCNCLFAPAFQVLLLFNWCKSINYVQCIYFGYIKDFLMKYKSLIMDLSDIRCSNDQDDEYNLTPVSILCSWAKNYKIFVVVSIIYIISWVNHIHVAFLLFLKFYITFIYWF